MAGTLKDIRELEQSIESRGDYGITKQDLLDLLKSQAKVGGVLVVNDGESPAADIVIQAGWNRIDIWDRSIDTQGVADGLDDATDPGGWFRIKAAGAGDYDFSASLRVQVDTAGDYKVRVSHVPADGMVQTTPFQDEANIGVGEVGHLAIAAGIEKDVEKDERLQMEIRGPNGATVLVRYGQFGVWR